MKLGETIGDSLFICCKTASPVDIGDAVTLVSNYTVTRTGRGVFGQRVEYPLQEDKIMIKVHGVCTFKCVDFGFVGDGVEMAYNGSVRCVRNGNGIVIGLAENTVDVLL